jgi:hypothetical protein
MQNVKTLNNVDGERDKSVRIIFNPLLFSNFSFVVQGHEAYLIYVWKTILVSKRK